MVEPKYFIFDLDGTLALSEHIKMQATQVACEQLQIAPITEDEYYSWVGQPTETVMRNLLQARDIEPTKELLHEIISKRRKLYRERLHMIEAHEPVVSLLRALSAHYKTGLATTTIREIGLVLVEQLGLTDLFDVLVFGDDVTHNKPDPECYELVAKQLHARPEECLIFEDSDSGVAAAEAFGAQVVRVSI